MRRALVDVSMESANVSSIVTDKVPAATVCVRAKMDSPEIHARFVSFTEKKVQRMI